MVKIYQDFRDENGVRINGRTKLFIKETLEDGSIDRYNSGIAFVTEENGTQFIVDDWLIPQLDKVIFKDGTLKVKEGEELVEPVKTVLEREEEELLKRLADLRAKKTADTEEVTVEP